MTLKNSLFLIGFAALFFACSENIDSASVESPRDEYVLQNSQIKNLDVSKAYKVICIGNSITLHLENEKVGWKSRHGMAASRPELDYVHRLQSTLRKDNASTEVLPASIGAWELDPSINLDSSLSEVVKDADVIVVRLGENMDDDKDVDYYEAAFDSLFAYCARHADYVIATGLYWPHAKKERACMWAAKKHGIRVAPIDWIFELGNIVRPSKGDTILDYDYKPYPINSEFICTHPNDLGMEKIAEEIYKTMIGDFSLRRK